MATVRGVEYYNDSKATNVDATIKAIQSFPGRLHLILGGKDKGSDYTVLNELLAQRAKRVYTIGAAAAKIESQLRGVEVVHAETLESAVKRASEEAEAGDVVLLAPACASFDQFESYEHRGRVFKELVRALAAREGERQERDNTHFRRRQLMAKRVSVDKWLFGVTLLLVFVGLVMVFSASAVMAKERFGSPYSFLIKQLVWAAAGVIAMVVAMNIDYKQLRRPAVVFSFLGTHLPASDCGLLLPRLAQYAPLDQIRHSVLPAI